MKFDFKNSDVVQCRVIRPIILNGGPQKAGTVAEVDGWLAKQLMASSNPSLERVTEVEPKPIVERDTEVIVSTPDPVDAPPPPPPPPRKRRKSQGNGV